MRAESATRQLSIAFQTDKALTAYGALAAAVENYGFDAVTVYNDMLYQPAWLPLLEMARATQRITLGVAAVNPFTCHPINIAGNIALIDEASHGRAYLGLARGSWLGFVGLHPQRSVTALREALRAVRHLLRRDPAPLPGEIFPLAGGDALRWPILRPDIPFLLGAWGEQTIRACLDEITAIKIGGSANPDVIPHFRRILDFDAATYGVQRMRRETEDAAATQRKVEIVIGAVSVVDEDGAAARRLARREVALYLPVVAELDPTTSIEPELLGRLKEAAARYDFAAAAALISDDLLDRFAIAGAPDAVAAHAEALFAAGATRVEFGTPHGLTPERGLQLLGKQVRPRISR
ncbi:MAG TPA: LLM class flavin-dependent oxidoreductase [Caldilinea sp.]|nr:LLM class flavin-dependent oxidoreductase [Caldilinea sp.]